jgi:hypothetical protein
MSFIGGPHVGFGVGPTGGFVPDDVPQAEADALIALYNATNGDSWTNNTNWLVDTTVGDWFGVTVAGGHVTEIDLNNNNLDGEWSDSELTPMTSLEKIIAWGNVALNCSFSLADLPDTATQLDIANTISTTSGSLVDLPNTMITLVLDSTSSNLGSGALSDLPASIRTFRVDGITLTLTGGAAAISATGLLRIEASDLGLAEANVDDILERIYTDRAIFTDADPDLFIGGTNATPSGVYQDGDPPTTGLEYVYELANDPEAEGFNTWSITYSGGSAP